MTPTEQEEPTDLRHEDLVAELKAKPEFLRVAAGALREIAQLVLDDGLPGAAAKADLTVPWAYDADALERQLGDQEAASWIGTTVGLYLAEAAHETVAMAALLDAGLVTASLSPLLRSIFERLGVATWILNEESDSMERAWRASLNAIICFKHYRASIDQLRASNAEKKVMAKQHRELREKVKVWFSPEVDPQEPDDCTKWTRGGFGFPDYDELAAGSMPRSMPIGVRRGMYTAMCGMTHPNIIVLGETIRPTANGGVEFFHRPEDIEKLVRATFATFLGGIKLWSGYFNTEADFDAFVVRADALADKFDAVFGSVS